ncbi:hypothetical protein MPER_10740, partial [Moniliophthora perniciosa FA553]
APRVSTVEIASDANGPRVNVSASKEVILSAGSFNTPQLLMLSGIGPRADLEALANGSMGSQPDRIICQCTSCANGSKLKVSGLEDPSSGPGSANLMAGMTPNFEPVAGVPVVPSVGRFFSVLTSVMSPTSRGSVKLSSSNPFDQPVIDYGLYTTEFDINAQVEAMKMVRDFVSLPQFQGIVEGPFGALANATTDQDLAAYARANAQIYSHPSCTASMGPGGVVDSRLKVKGVEGLRVVDASVFPLIPECNTMAPVFIVAERAADLIQCDYRTCN